MHFHNQLGDPSAMATNALPQGKPRRYKSLRTIAALVVREMVSTYGRSPGGYVWAILEPVAAIAVLSVAFSYAFKVPSLGTNFPIFFASGYLAFVLYADVAAKTARSIRFSRQLLNYPAVRYTDTIFARLFLSLLTQVTVFYIVIVGMHLVMDLNTVIDPVPIMIALAMAASIGLSVGVLNCYLTTVYPVWEQFWNIVTRPLFLISGVIITYETAPQQLQSVLWYNPLIHFTGVARRGFYPTYEASYVSYTYFFTCTLVVGTLGLMLLYRHHKTLTEI